MHPLGFSAIENNINEGMTTIEEKKRNREQGTRKNRSNQRVSNMIDMINTGLNTSEASSDDNDDLGEFNPPPAPVPGAESSSPNIGYPAGAVQPTSLPSGGGKGTARPYAPQSSQQTDAAVAPEAFSDLQSNSAQQYYNQWAPSYNRMSDPATPNNELLQKLDHVIHLLETEQDEKTGHVTEEIILYTFLGVFMIFIVDSFARVGKYVR